MIIRASLVLLACWLTGHSADGLYFKYKLSPNIRELTIETLQNENTRMPREVDHWMHKNSKKLVVLDRNNKYVAAFIQRLIDLIEKEKQNDKQMSKLSNAQQLPCYRSFGNLFNSRFKKCGQGSKATAKPVIKLVTVDMIPLETEDVFVDPTRQGSGDDTDSTDTDSSDTSDLEDDKIKRVVNNLRRQGHPLYRSSAWSDEDNTVQKGNRLKRFEVVTNGHTNVKESYNSDSDNQNNDGEKTDSANSDQEQVHKEVNKAKRFKKGSKGRYTHDNDKDSDKEEFKPKHKKHKSEEKETEEESSLEDVDKFEKKNKGKRFKKVTKAKNNQIDDEASDIEWKEKHKSEEKETTEQFGDLSLEDEDEFEKKSKKKKNGKKKKDSVNYIYLQGSKPVNSDMESDDDTRRDGINRLRDVFMPKRNIWESSEIQHLSYYWFNGPQGHVLYS